MKGKKLNYLRLSKWVDRVHGIVSLLIFLIGFASHCLVFYYLQPIAEETPMASMFCHCSAFVLGAWILALLLDGEWKSLAWWLHYLGKLAIPATICAIAASQAHLARSEAWWALVPVVLIGLVTMGLILGYDEVMNRVRRRVFGDTAKIGNKWCRFYEFRS